MRVGEKKKERERRSRDGTGKERVSFRGRGGETEKRVGISRG